MRERERERAEGEVTGALPKISLDTDTRVITFADSNLIVNETGWSAMPGNRHPWFTSHVFSTESFS